jgi:F-type H+-transporting ATPase subunit epsilon
MIMRVRILLPEKVLADHDDAIKVSAEALDGGFCLKPRHVDYVSVLPPGLVGITTSRGEEIFYAVAEGMVVKHGEDVRFAVRDGAGGSDLGLLREVIGERFAERDEDEMQASKIAWKMEAGFIRRLMELERGY